MTNTRRKLEMLLKRGMSMEGIADKLHVSLSTIYRWKTSRKEPDIMRALEISLDALVANKKAKVR